MKPLNRRKFLKSTAAFAALATARSWSEPERKNPRILVRGSWQSVNIGDIAHPIGLLLLLTKAAPHAEFVLWPTDIGNGARELITSTFPNLTIVEGQLDERGHPTTTELMREWRRCDFWAHSSGSAFPARVQAAAWRRLTKKPFGVFGVSDDPVYGFGPGQIPTGGTLAELAAAIKKLPPNHIDKDSRWLIDEASFMFCRDSISRDYLESQHVHPPILEFGPDTTFAMTLTDEARATAFLKKNGLKEAEFICVIPRLRYTPYHKMRATSPTDIDRIKDSIDNATFDQDHARLRDMMILWARNTGHKILVCPEMTYQVELSKKVLIDPLPEDVKRQVVWRDSYWMPDEAAATYAKAVAVVSIECHSPILSLVNGTPAIHVRQPTDTVKGQMYQDIGASDWVVEIEQTSGEQLWEKLAKIHSDPGNARMRVAAVMKEVHQRQDRMVRAFLKSIA